MVKVPEKISLYDRITLRQSFGKWKELNEYYGNINQKVIDFSIISSKEIISKLKEEKIKLQSNSMFGPEYESVFEYKPYSPESENIENILDNNIEELIDIKYNKPIIKSEEKVEEDKPKTKKKKKGTLDKKGSVKEESDIGLLKKNQILLRKNYLKKKQVKKLKKNHLKKLKKNHLKKLKKNQVKKLKKNHLKKLKKNQVKKLKKNQLKKLNKIKN